MLGRARAQVWAYSPHYRRPRHFHAEPELNCIAAGSARFGVGDTVVQASAGELLVFPPGQDHVMLGGSQDLVLYAVGLEPELAAEVLRGATLVGATAMHVRPRADDFRVMAARAAALSGCDARPQDVAELWERAHRSRRQQVAGRGGEWHVLTRRTLDVGHGAGAWSRRPGSSRARQRKRGQPPLSPRRGHDAGSVPHPSQALALHSRGRRACREPAKIRGFFWVRLLFAVPSRVSRGVLLRPARVLCERSARADGRRVRARVAPLGWQPRPMKNLA